MKQILLLALLGFFTLHSKGQKRFYLDEMEGFDQVETGWNTPKRRTNLSNKPLSLGGKVYERGVCIHAFSEFKIKLDGKTRSFHAILGLDDMVAKLNGAPVSVRFFRDGSRIWHMDTLRPGADPVEINLNLEGARILRVEIEGLGGTHHTHFDMCDAWFDVAGENPKIYHREPEAAQIRTPKPGPKPRITGPSVFGVRPGSPLVFRFTATGTKPIRFSATNLPAGIQLDANTGQLSGIVSKEGEYSVTVTATNALGSASRQWKLKAGPLLSLTPPLGWNSWNCWGMSVDADKVLRSARAMVQSGLIDHGWSYINIDDGWQGPTRNPESGEITTDPVKFPDMKKLADEIHGLGLKFGIYTSPGTLTCGKRLGSLAHEEIDAATYTQWGVDYLKHDYCSYGEIVKQTKEQFYYAKRPYVIMGEAIRKQKRDIVYSLCQYGANEVWKWGHSVDGNLWRTTGDIIDTWNSMRVIGFRQEACLPYTKPGRWLDPDMLVVGRVGWGPNLHPTRLTPNEQYTHITLWSVLAAPLILGCDLENLDDFTLNLLTNDEVLEINQDPLGAQGREIKGDEAIKWYIKPLENGDYAVAVFNFTETDREVEIRWEDLKLSGKFRLRDVWRQTDLKSGGQGWKGKVGFHGTELFRLKKI